MCITVHHYMQGKLRLKRHTSQQLGIVLYDRVMNEYDELWTNTTIILEQLEKHMDDPFDAKCFLSDLFMVTIHCYYAHSHDM